MSNTKSFAKTSKGDKKGDKIILSRVEEKYSGVQDWRAVCFFCFSLIREETVVE